MSIKQPELQVKQPHARVTHYGLNEMEVCVPEDWLDITIIQFANAKLRCIAEHHWQMTGGKKDCGFEDGHVHIELHAVEGEAPVSDGNGQAAGILNQSSTGIHSHVIITFLSKANAPELDAAADSFELLAQYLRTKALALKAGAERDGLSADRYFAEAETLGNRLLGQFKGTLALLM